MKTPRFLAAATFSDGLLYVIGGSNEEGERLSTVEAYDPRTNSWKAEAQIPIARSYPAVGTLADGQIIAAGGGIEGHGPLADVELYTPWTNSWEQLAPLLQPSSGGNTGQILWGRVFYVLGGFVGTAVEANGFVESTTVDGW